MKLVTALLEEGADPTGPRMLLVHDDRYFLGPIFLGLSADTVMDLQGTRRLWQRQGEPRRRDEMARLLDFYFDCSSPWTYLAFHAVQPIAAELGAEIAWKPILVGGVFNAVNQTVYDSRAKPNPLKQAYMLKDLADWARLYGLRIVFPPKVFPGEQRQMHARRLHGARRRQARALRHRRLRSLLGRRSRHRARGGAGRHRRPRRPRAPALLRRHRDRLPARRGCAPTPTS